MRLPVALHATHGAAVTIWPRIERRTSRTSPAPPHTSQRAGWVPGSQPEPSQRSHATGRRTSTVAVVPNAACGEVEVHDRLGVGRARRARLTAPLPNGSPPKNASKRSPKPNASPRCRRPRSGPPTRCRRRRTRRSGGGARGRGASRTRLVDLLELASGVGIVGVAVGVVLARERAVGALDLVVGRVPGDAEDLVVVSHAGSCLTRGPGRAAAEMASTAASACR